MYEISSVISAYSSDRPNGPCGRRRNGPMRPCTGPVPQRQQSEQSRMRRTAERDSHAPARPGPGRRVLPHRRRPDEHRSDAAGSDHRRPATLRRAGRETGYVSTYDIPLRLRSRVVGRSRPRPDHTTPPRRRRHRARPGARRRRAGQGLLAERWNASVGDAFEVFRSNALFRHPRLSDLTARIIAGDFDAMAIPAPTTVRPEERRG